MKIAGKRLGPAEVESALASHPAVAESGRRRAFRDEVKGEAIWCFVVLKPGIERRRPRARSSPAVVAAPRQVVRAVQVVFVDELPKTRSAKIVAPGAPRRSPSARIPATCRAWRTRALDAIRASVAGPR